MVRTTTDDATDDESTTTIRRPLRGTDDVEVGDVIGVSGPDWLPKSDLEVVDVDPDWAKNRVTTARGDEDPVVFTARIPDRKNARDYTFRVDEYGGVVTTGSNGTFGVSVTVEKEAEPDTVECSLCGSVPSGLGDGMSAVDEDEVPPRCRNANRHVVDTDKAPEGTVWVCPSCREWVEDDE